MNAQHIDGCRMGPTTETRFASLERIPGLDTSGWFDAGDVDIHLRNRKPDLLQQIEHGALADECLARAYVGDLLKK